MALQNGIVSEAQKESIQTATPEGFENLRALLIYTTGCAEPEELGAMQEVAL